MLHRQNRNTSGFTLIELTIVLGIAGVLIGGVWRLLAAGNQQTRDQTVANQHAQFISSLSTYFESDKGQAYLTGLTAGTAYKIVPLMTEANCTASTPTPEDFCSALPPGFENLNAYGQQYAIGVIKESGSPAPRSYSFMLMTTKAQGETIPDASGGRISALIGGDGGFIYSSDVCGANNACGAYGAWKKNPSDYGLSSLAKEGRIASVSYRGSAWSSINPWLARQKIDSNNPPIFNTMATPLYLGNTATLFAQGNVIDMAAEGATTGGGTIALHGGKLNMEGLSEIRGTALSADGGVSLYKNMVSETNAALIVADNGGCGTWDCNAIAHFTGRVEVTGELTVNGMYSNTFIYKGSDIRLKKDIAPLANSMDMVMKLKPVSFTYKAGGKKSLGVIAQDLEQVYPQLVADMGDGKKAVDYTGLIGPLIDAVQQLKRENDDLREQVKALQEKR